MARWQHYIDGQRGGHGRSDPTSTLSIRARGEPVAEVSGRRCSRCQSAAVARAAAVAAPAWRALRPMDRGRILVRIAGKIREQVRSTGLPWRALSQAKPSWHSPIEIEIAAQYFEFYGGLVQRLINGETIRARRRGYHFLHHCASPMVSWGVITPWNGPPQPGGPWQ